MEFTKEMNGNTGFSGVVGRKCLVDITLNKVETKVVFDGLIVEDTEDTLILSQKDGLQRLKIEHKGIQTFKGFGDNDLILKIGKSSVGAIKSLVD